LRDGLRAKFIKNGVAGDKLKDFILFNIPW
jgi:hypothetical protein